MPILRTRDDLRIAFLAHCKAEGKTRKTLVEMLKENDIRIFGSLKTVNSTDKRGRYRCSFDRIIAWCNNMGYDVQFILRKREQNITKE